MIATSCRPILSINSLSSKVEWAKQMNDETISTATANSQRLKPIAGECVNEPCDCTWHRCQRENHEKMPNEKRVDILDLLCLISSMNTVNFVRFYFHSFTIKIIEI